MATADALTWLIRHGGFRLRRTSSPRTGTSTRQAAGLQSPCLQALRWQPQQQQQTQRHGGGLLLRDIKTANSLAPAQQQDLCFLVSSVF